uniref:OTU domain-containing protein n=1 Tax=Scylla olivacea TaxID=85551 RepID=A0A0P4W417_SCYOL
MQRCRSTVLSLHVSRLHLACSSSGLASSSEISPATPDSEGTGWSAWERRLSPGEFGSKARRYWSSEESGYVEGLEAPLDNAHPHLSPVHEIKEKENSDSSTSTPRHTNSWGSLNNNTTPNNITNTAINTNKNQTNNNNTPVMGNKTSSHNDNSWSAPTTATSPDQSTTGLGTSSAIGPKLELMKYANTEWQGNTPKAQTIKQGYSAISMELNFKHLRQVRGDNYCGVRAALYQVLARGFAVPSGHTTHSRLASELTQGATWLRDWTFGHRLTYNREDVLNGFLDCLDALDSLVLNLMGCENRECVVLARVNRDPLLDVRLCEAVKLHMLAAALDLHAANTCGESVPLFAMIMFARHSSMTPRDLLRNHLNPVGDTAGLEQVGKIFCRYLRSPWALTLFFISRSWFL